LGAGWAIPILALPAFVLARREHPGPEEPMSSADPGGTGATEADKAAILESALSLAETQILAQNEDEASLDAQAMGLVAFDGALIGAVLAAQERIGSLWWTALIAILISAVIALSSESLVALRDALRGRPRTPEGDLGPAAADFYEKYGGQRALPARELLLSEMRVAFNENTPRIARKFAAIRMGVAALFVGLFVAGLLIAFATPTKLKPCQPNVRSSVKHPCRSRRRLASRTSGRAALSNRDRTAPVG
jgi:hypothetical protein